MGILAALIVLNRLITLTTLFNRLAKRPTLRGVNLSPVSPVMRCIRLLATVTQHFLPRCPAQALPPHTFAYPSTKTTGPREPLYALSFPPRKLPFN